MKNEFYSTIQQSIYCREHDENDVQFQFQFSIINNQIT